MAKKLNATERKSLLSTIVADTNSETGYSLVNPEHVKDLVDGGQIEVNPNIKVEGKIAARATAALLNSHASPVEPVVAEIKTAFALMNGIPLAPAKRGGKKTEEYPFSKMEVGQSFVVPSTDNSPKPWETFASTVSSATRRFSIVSDTETKLNRKGKVVPVLIPTKRFTLREVRAGQTYEGSTFVEPVNGARVFREQ